MRVALLLLVSVDYLAACSPQGPEVEVVVPHVKEPVTRVFFHAEAIAAAIYSQIGVRVLWRAAGGANPSCEKRGMLHRIVMVPEHIHRFPSRSRGHRISRAKQGSCLTVFMDRQKDLVAAQPTTALT
jgi:hypothetical protein